MGRVSFLCRAALDIVTTGHGSQTKHAQLCSTLIEIVHIEMVSGGAVAGKVDAKFATCKEANTVHKARLKFHNSQGPTMWHGAADDDAKSRWCLVSSCKEYLKGNL